MKKYLLCLITIALFFIVPDIKAKEAVKICDYNFYDSISDKQLKAEVTVYDNNTYKASIYYYRNIYQASGSMTTIIDSKPGKTILNVSTAGDIASGKCPSYIYVSNFNSDVNVVLTDDDNTYKEKYCTGNCIATNSTDIAISQEEIAAGNKLIDDMLISLKSQIDKFKNYDIKSSECYKPLTSAGYSAIAPYEDCINSLKSDNVYTTNAYSEVMNLKNSNEYWQKSEKMAECEEVYKKYDFEYTYLMTTLEHAANEETIKSCEENKQAAGNTAFDSCIKEGKEKREEFEKQLDALRKRAADIEGEKVDNTCEGLIGKNTLELLKVVRNIIMTVGPILAAVLGTYDMLQAMASGEDDAKKKAMKKFKGRLIAAVLLLLAPYIIYLLLQISNKAGKDCINPIESTAQTEYIVNDMSRNILK